MSVGKMVKNFLSKTKKQFYQMTFSKHDKELEEWRRIEHIETSEFESVKYMNVRNKLN